LPEHVQEEIDITQYLPPMLCRPRGWKNVSDGGYLTIKDNVLLNSYHSLPLNLRAINRLQQVKLTLNQHILDQEETISAELSTVEQIEQFEEFKRQSNILYEIYQGKPFYFVWKYDKRGRMYSQGYHINLQGSEYKRASVDLYDKEVVTQ
jgi:DNA-directed RNA polymerase